MNKTNTILKPYLRKFVLKTHPDFFHKDTLRKQTNASSLQKLYNILQPEHSTTINTCKLEFYTKEHKKKKATTIFDKSDNEWNKANSFFQLCKQLDISVLQSDLDLVNEMIKPKIHNKSLTKEFAEQFYKNHVNLTNDKKTDSSQILNHKLVMFDPKITNKNLTAQKLSAWLPELNPEKWWGKIPILIISSNSELPSKDLTKGILIIKEDMELKDVKKYLDKSLEEL